MEQGKSKQQRMRELVELLNRARKAYEQDNTEIMSNYEYDRLYDELEELEKELIKTTSHYEYDYKPYSDRI